jgi:hypothetical protein
VAGQLVEQRADAPGGQVGVAGTEYAQLGDLVLVAEVEQCVPDDQEDQFKQRAACCACDEWRE